MKRKREFYLLSAIHALLFVLMIVLVKFVDVAAIGPNGSTIGLSHINNAVHNLFGVQMFWYQVTKVTGILALLMCVFFAGLGAYQLYQTKDIKKVDKEIIYLGVIYVITILLYVVFEKVVINYRPIIMPDETELEASFPSSHTMLVATVFMTAAMKFRKMISDPKMQQIAVWACIAIAVITVIGRLICGCHWFSDILAGLWISIALIFLYRGLTYTPKKKKK